MAAAPPDLTNDPVGSDTVVALDPTHPVTVRTGVNAGDFVSWVSPGGTRHGRVMAVRTRGEVRMRDGLVINATAGAPVAIILMYEQGDAGWKPVGKEVARPTRGLSKIQVPLARGGPFRPAIVAAKTDRVAEVYLYGDIGFSWMDAGITAKTFRAEVEDLRPFDELTVRINSGGGDVFEGLAIHNYLSRINEPVTAHVDALCASIATIIMLAADKVIAAEASQLMIHRAWTFQGGNVNDMQKTVDRLAMTDGQMAALYARKTGDTPDAMLQLMDAETWFTADDAKAAKLVDDVENVPSPRAAASVDRPWIHRAPAALGRGAKAAARLAAVQRRVAAYLTE